MNEDFKILISQIKGHDLEKLKREGRDYEFTDIYDQLKRLYESLDDLERNGDFINELPETKEQDIYNYLNSFKDIVSQISAFSPQNGNPQGLRDSLAAQIKSLYSALYERLIQPLDVFLLKKRMSTRKDTTIIKKAQEELSKIQVVSDEVSELLESSRKATAQVGVNVFSSVFEDQSADHQRTARKWLIASIILTASFVIIILLITWDTINAIKGIANPVEVLTLFLAKVFPVTIGYYLLYQFIKNYNVSMHLFTTNKHRANVLKTFEAFMKSTDDPKVRDTVLIKASEAIFTGGETGYLSNKLSQQKEEFSPVNLIDIIKKND